MATTSSSLLLHLLRPSPFSASLRPTMRGRPERRIFTPFAGPSENSRKEEVVVVGAGIAGLATALSLLRFFLSLFPYLLWPQTGLDFTELPLYGRLGVRSVVLEQGDSLRTGGTSLTLFKNGWRALDVIGVGDELRSQFLRIQGYVQTLKIPSWIAFLCFFLIPPYRMWGFLKSLVVRAPVQAGDEVGGWKGAPFIFIRRRSSRVIRELIIPVMIRDS